MLKRWIALLLVSLMPIMASSLAQGQDANAKSVRVALVKMPYVGERNVPDTSRGPDYLEEGGIRKLLEQQGAQVKPPDTVALTAEEEKTYGSWNHLALASGDLAKLVSEERRNGYFPVGLLANCNGLLGMLSGLQHSGPIWKTLARRNGVYRCAWRFQYAGDHAERNAWRDAGGHRRRAMPHADAHQGRPGACHTDATHRRNVRARYGPARAGTAGSLGDSATHSGRRADAFGKLASGNETAVGSLPT